LENILRLREVDDLQPIYLLKPVSREF